ncbi:MAG: flagellar hook-associated protein FlgK [Candidatus Paceibacteria bacterium]|jgi:flagellar hook-associated protein FlgK
MAGIGLNTGLKALLAAQASLDTVGHNISNANTPGFSRQRLEVSSSAALMQRGRLIGSGVNADIVTRSTDALLLVRTTAQVSSLSRLESALGGMTEVEALLGEPGSFGLGSGLSNFFGAVSELSNSTEDLVLRTGMVQMATAMTTQFNQLSTTMSSLRQDTGGQTRIQVKKVNAIASQIVTINRQVAQTEATGIPANDLRDSREEKMRELASFVDIEFHEDDNGIVRITTGGRLLVGANRSFEMSAVVQGDGAVELFLEGSTVPIKLSRGKIAGLVRVVEDFIPGLQGDFDTLARNLIFEMNRLHSTGTPAGGSFANITSSYSASDNDLDGLIEDELLSNSGLPFDIQDGDLYVNVSRLDTGAFDSHKISIDRSSTTVGDLLAELNAVNGVNANLNSFGRLQVFADAGFGYDFAPRLDTEPDKSGTLGSSHASIGTGGDGPYSLVDGDTVDLSGPVGPFTVTLNAADFSEMSEATAKEIASVMNADSNMQANGMRAVVTGDRLFIQTAATGASSSLTIVGGTALPALSLAAGAVVNGSATGVDIKIGGEYTGAENGYFRFIPRGDGTVGTTPGLEVDVFTETGQLVATLDLGDSYQPGTVIEVDKGVNVSFGFGSLSATHNDQTQVELIADADTSDVLAAFGLNSLFTGTGAEDIAIRGDLEVDPTLLAAGTSGASGDNTSLLAMLSLQSNGVGGLGGETLGDFYGDVVSDVGFEISTTSSTRDVEEFLLQNLQSRREQTSGVNVDEELVEMVRFEQNFNAAARYIQVLNDLEQEILQLI